MPDRCPPGGHRRDGQDAAGTPATTTVAVVGGGASGCLTAAHLAAATARRSGTVELLLVEPRPVGQGVAYSTTDPRHRLNVPSCGMSAWPHDAGHFLRWLRATVDPDATAGGYAARRDYRDYLTATLKEALVAAPGVRLTRVTARVTDAQRAGRRLRLALDDGTSRTVDAVVLATGHAAPATGWAPDALRRSARFVADPWDRSAPAPVVPAGGSVLLVGAGLTMADMAMSWGGADVRVHVTSRHGLLPLPHARATAGPLELRQPLPDGPLTLAQARHLVFDHLRASGDWRRAVDGLRPVTAELWGRLDDRSRAAFLATGARRWDRVRHRVDPGVYDALDRLRREQRLDVHAAPVVGASERDDGIEVVLGDGARLVVDAVVNCTGSAGTVGSSTDPLVRTLLRTGLAAPGPLDLGFRTDAAGRLAPANGAGAPAAIWAIGPLRKGELWESTAVPEIRQQAARLARDVVATLSSGRPARSGDRAVNAA